MAVGVFFRHRPSDTIVETMQCDFFPRKVGVCITSWEIPQISPCPLHDGFGFEAAVEKRLVVMGCCTVL